MAEVESRKRILNAALKLMSEKGVAGTSMRKVAQAADLNVASLYHYFPSKADLLRSVLEERGYLERLGTELPPDPVHSAANSPAERLEALVSWLWWASRQEEDVWRLLVGESMRGNAFARAEAMAWVDGIDVAVASWLRDLIPEHSQDAERVARLIRATLFSLIIEHMALGPDDDRSADLIRDLVAIIN